MLSAGAACATVRPCAADGGFWRRHSSLSWTRSTDIERLSRDADLLVVMPEGGGAGFYSDWLSGPRWETRVFLAAGDGKPGPLDAAGVATDRIEVSIGAQNRAFAQHLQAVGTAATVDLYGAGTHNWAYWQRELHRAWPLLTADLLR